jgi:uncharacterized membrane protein YuzA (DUF378 family)
LNFQVIRIFQLAVVARLLELHASRVTRTSFVIVQIPSIAVDELVLIFEDDFAKDQKWLSTPSDCKF